MPAYGVSQKNNNIGQAYFFFSPRPPPFPSFALAPTVRVTIFTVRKSKMAATTILRTRTRFLPPKIRLRCRLAVIHIFTKEGYTDDVYLDDFYGAEHPADSHFAFARVQDLSDELGLQSSSEKDCHPSTRMICLGILADTEKMLFEVPADRLSDLKTELLQWTQFSTFTRRQLQSLLGKLSFVTACVRPGRIFMSRAFKSPAQFAF